MQVTDMSDVPIQGRRVILCSRCLKETRITEEDPSTPSLPHDLGVNCSKEAEDLVETSKKQLEEQHAAVTGNAAKYIR